MHTNSREGANLAQARLNNTAFGVMRSAAAFVFKRPLLIAFLIMGLYVAVFFHGTQPSQLERASYNVAVAQVTKTTDAQTHLDSMLATKKTYRQHLEAFWVCNATCQVLKIAFHAAEKQWEVAEVQVRAGLAKAKGEFDLFSSVAVLDCRGLFTSLCLIAWRRWLLESLWDLVFGVHYPGAALLYGVLLLQMLALNASSGLLRAGVHFLWHLWEAQSPYASKSIFHRLVFIAIVGQAAVSVILAGLALGWSAGGFIVYVGCSFSIAWAATPVKMQRALSIYLATLGSVYVLCQLGFLPPLRQPVDPAI